MIRSRRVLKDGKLHDAVSSACDRDHVDDVKC